jgi:5-formyltetrahydrofolate cyclo-ligase
MVQTKTEVRRLIKERLSHISLEENQLRSEKVCRNFIKTKVWNEAEIILCFVCMNDEVDTSLLLQEAICKNKILAAPRMSKENIVFHRIEDQSGCSDEHPYGVHEPSANNEIVDPDEHRAMNILIVTPGLAFDTEGNRLGRGRGYYDKFISKYRTPSRRSGWLKAISVAFDFQLVGKVPTAAHDMKVDGIITDERIIEVKEDSHGRN